MLFISHEPVPEQGLKRSRRPRLVDVAELAGVSVAAVSVVLNNRIGQSARVSEETQQRVLAAARALGYVANPLARSLAGGRTNIIAVFTFEAVFPLDHRDFYYPFLVGIEEEASRLGYDLLLLTSPDDENGKRHIYRDGINRLRIADGSILLGFGSRPELEALLDEGYPFVFVGRRESSGDRVSYVAAGYAEATADIVRMMFQHGHRRLAYLESADNESAHDRRQGLIQAHAQIGLTHDPALMWRGEPADYSPAVMTSLLRAGATGFVVENDALGEKVLAVGKSLDLCCPADYSLAVLGDPLSLTAPNYTWTTFKVPRREMGIEAVRLLVKMLDDTSEDRATPYRATLPCTVVPGDTLGPPREHSFSDSE